MQQANNGDLLPPAVVTTALSLSHNTGDATAASALNLLLGQMVGAVAVSKSQGLSTTKTQANVNAVLFPFQRRRDGEPSFDCGRFRSGLQLTFMATFLALAPVIAGVLGLGGTAYMWWAQRKSAANTAPMRANAIAARDQEERTEVATDVQGGNTEKFEEDIEP